MNSIEHGSLTHLRPSLFALGRTCSESSAQELAGLKVTGCFDSDKYAFARNLSVAAAPCASTGQHPANQSVAFRVGKDKAAAEQQAQERLKEATAAVPQGSIVAERQ